MSARRMGTMSLAVVLMLVGSITSADAQATALSLPLALVDAPSPALVAQAPAPPQPAAPPAQAAPAQAPLPSPAPARTPVPVRTGPRLTGLSAVLVAGDEGPATTSRGNAPQLEVPDAAKKALASISSFLPYKSYSMVDAGLISVSVIRGGFILMRDPALPDTSLRLALQPMTPPPGVDTYEIGVSLNEIDGTKPDEKATGRSVISASVNMAVGETVVVGTSRIGGGRKAYVLLLTAIGK